MYKKRSISAFIMESKMNNDTYNVENVSLNEH
jgi:hypothetical protein